MPPFTLILFYLGRKVEISMRLRSVQMDNVNGFGHCARFCMFI